MNIGVGGWGIKLQRMFHNIPTESPMDFKNKIHIEGRKLKLNRMIQNEKY